MLSSSLAGPVERRRGRILARNQRVERIFWTVAAQHVDSEFVRSENAQDRVDVLVDALQPRALSRDGEIHVIASRAL